MLFGHIDPVDFATLQTCGRASSSGHLVASSPYPRDEVLESITRLTFQGLIQDDAPIGTASTYAATPSGREILDFARRIEFSPGGPLGLGWVEYYSQGWCNVFAKAANEAFDGRVYLVVTDPDDLAYEAPDPDDSLPVVIHVYAIIRRDDRDWALDVFGMRPLESVEREVVERYSRFIVACEEMPDHRLAHHTKNAGSTCPSNPFRSLPEITPSMLEKAHQHVQEVFLPFKARNLRSQSKSEPATFRP